MTEMESFDQALDHLIAEWMDKGASHVEVCRALGGATAHVADHNMRLTDRWFAANGKFNRTYLDPEEADRERNG